MSNTFRGNWHDVREYTRLGAPTARRVWVISAVLTVGPLLPIHPPTPDMTPHRAN